MLAKALRCYDVLYNQRHGGDISLFVGEKDSQYRVWTEDRRHFSAE